MADKIPILKIREKGSDEWKDIRAIRGLSAYQIWLKQPGNAGKAEAEFIASLKGAPGSIENIDQASLEFTVAATRENINTGETFAVLFGKIQKWFSSFKALAFKDTVDWDTDVDNKPTIPNAQVNSDWNASSGVAEIRNKPSIPAKTSDLTNDSSYQNAIQVSASITAHNASETAHTDIRDKVDTVDAIARGKARARVFDTVAELDAWLAVPANVEELQVGDNFYIRATDVPDFWWDGAQKLALEGEKVDLTNLLTIEDAALIYAKQTIFRSTMLVAGDWVADEDRFRITVSDAAIVDGTKVVITPSTQADLDKMTDAGFSPLPETAVGSVTIYAQYQPTENTNINYSISF